MKTKRTNISIPMDLARQLKELEMQEKIKVNLSKLCSNAIAQFFEFYMENKKEIADSFEAIENAKFEREYLKDNCITYQIDSKSVFDLTDLESILNNERNES